jgi:RimJ/RimL family protein N-acetyltransferase
MSGVDAPEASANSEGIPRENLAVPDSKLSLRLDTDRLSLEPVRLADAEDMFEIMRDPAIGALMGEPPPESVAFMRVRIEDWIRGPGPRKMNAG